MAYFLPLQEKTASDLVVIFTKEVWKFHGLPTDIVADQDLGFTSEVGQKFLEIL